MLFTKVDDFASTGRCEMSACQTSPLGRIGHAAGLPVADGDGLTLGDGLTDGFGVVVTTGEPAGDALAVAASGVRATGAADEEQAASSAATVVSAMPART
jgi:hypothetical protein